MLAWLTKTHTFIQLQRMPFNRERADVWREACIIMAKGRYSKRSFAP